MFNLRHASARNCIERTLGILKSRFPILKSASGYSFKVSAELFTALCCLHNFIRHDGLTVKEFKPSLLPATQRIQRLREEIQAREPILSHGQKKKTGENMRDKIAEDMWRSYQNIMRSRRFPGVA